MIKAAIFDLDGTLACTLPDITEGMNRTRKRFGRRPLTENEILGFINGTTRQYIQNCFPDFDDEAAEKAEQIYLEEYSNCYIDKTYAYEGLVEAVRKLKESGIRVGVFTNKDNEHAGGIVRKLYGDLFEITVGTGRFPGKPDPTGAIYIADFLGAKPDETAFIGDSDVDVRTGQNAGMVCLDVSWGYRPEAFLIQQGAQYIAHSPEEILEIINKINHNS